MAHANSWIILVSDKLSYFEMMCFLIIGYFFATKVFFFRGRSESYERTLVESEHAHKLVVNLYSRTFIALLIILLSLVAISAAQSSS